MSSTSRHPVRLVRATLILGALALGFLVPVSAHHISCEHAGDPGADQHRCAICRHLGDGTPVLVATATMVVPMPMIGWVEAPVPVSVPRPAPAAQGRAPPVHLSMV